VVYTIDTKVIALAVKKGSCTETEDPVMPETVKSRVSTVPALSSKLDPMPRVKLDMSGESVSSALLETYQQGLKSYLVVALWNSSSLIYYSC
jgi:hypothetical protein